MTENKQMVLNIIKFIIDNLLISGICFALFLLFSLVVLAVLPADDFWYLCIFVPINFIFTRVVLCFRSIEVHEIGKYINKYKFLILLFVIIDVILFFSIFLLKFLWIFSVSFIIPILILYAIIYKISANIREKIYKSAISLFILSICIFTSSYILVKISDFHTINLYMEKNILLLSCVVLFISICITFLDNILIKWLNIYFKLSNLNIEEKKYKTILCYLIKISIYFYITYTVYCCSNNVVM